MIIFPTGIVITEIEDLGLLHIEADPEQWLRDILTEKCRLRRDALISEWRPRLFADSNVIDLPADTDALVQLITTRSDYQTRAESDAGLPESEVPALANTQRFNAQVRTGRTVRLFPGGITISDRERDCILAYVQDLEDWVLGALLGHINRGKKKMIRQYLPTLLVDPTVSTIPADEDRLIEVITGRADYKTLPEQLA